MLKYTVKWDCSEKFGCKQSNKFLQAAFIRFFNFIPIAFYIVIRWVRTKTAAFRGLYIDCRDIRTKNIAGERQKYQSSVST